MDEWAKKTWVTEPFMIPFDRRVLWHNVVDPEQNYGLIANEAVPPTLIEQQIQGIGVLSDLEVSHDASYLYLTLRLAGSKSPTEYEILLVSIPMTARWDRCAAREFRQDGLGVGIPSRYQEQ